MSAASIRIGTRGSDLALWQARDVAGRIECAANVKTELIIIKTQGDVQADTPMKPGVWPTGAFVTAIEKALAANEIDLAVHSYKDLETTSLPGLEIVATPPRGPVHDVLIASNEDSFERLRQALASQANSNSMHSSSANGLRIGTSSPRRTAQLQRAFAGCRTEAIRGNVPTRVAIVQRGDLDAVCLAAAGIERLGLTPAHMLELPIGQFPTAPAQGVIAVQARAGTTAAEAARAIDHDPTHRCAMAERVFLKEINAGCHAPVAASATQTDDASCTIHLHVQLFDETRRNVFDEIAQGSDPHELGCSLGQCALKWLGDL